jgi:hypothetical protein
MSTLVDQARSHVNAWESPKPVHHTMWANDAADLLRQLADRVQELEGKGEPVAWRHWHGEENGGWEYYEEASCADCQPLYTYPPFSVQPEKEERRPATDTHIALDFRKGVGMWMTPGTAFAAGFRSAERFHGISPSPSMVGREGDGK